MRFSVPGVAVDANLKQELEKISSAYAEASIGRMVQGSLRSSQVVACTSIQMGHERILNNSTKVHSRPDLIARK